MIRAVVDSSVLYSAFPMPTSIPAMVLAQASAGRVRLCLSCYILEETAGVLLRPKARRRAFDPAEVAEFCNGLAEECEMVISLPQLRAVPNDPKDDPLVATAVAGRADYLVTGDRRHLLVLREYEGVQIISPRDFIELLEALP
jgi:putative PIN family toxin of toxin-antitoxin system